MPAQVASGPTMLRVGERSSKDEKFAADEYVYADPGVGGTVVVAPRPKGETPSMENAIRAILKQRRMKQGGVVMPQDGNLREMATKHLFGNAKPRKAAAGINVTDPTVFQGSGLLQALLAAMGGQGETFAVGVPQVQQQLFGLLGQIIPGMLGLTDPLAQRKALGAPQFYSQRGDPAVYTQMPGGEFRHVGNPGVFHALGGEWANVQPVGEGFMGGMGDLGARITAADIPAVQAAFQKPTLGAQQLRTQRELRGLSGLPGAGQIPSFGI